MIRNSAEETPCLPQQEYIHPATRLALWCGALAAASLWQGAVLYGGVALASLSLVAAPLRRKAWQLIRRARWLFLCLFVVIAWSHGGGGFEMPGRDGLLLAAEQSLRLYAALLLTAVMLACTGREQMLAGLYTLMRPFGALRERLAVRLALTLGYLQEPEMSWRDWRSFLNEEGAREAGGEADGKIRLETGALRPRDAAVAGAGLLLLVLGRMAG